MPTDTPVAERRTATSPVRVIGGGRVSICSRASTEVVEWGDIILARSDRSYTWIVTRRGALRVRGPLHVVICSLAGLGFVQIHRRVAVNDSKVRRLIRSGRRRLDILLEDDMRLEVGRQFQRSVRDRFGAERREPSPPTSRPVRVILAKVPAHGDLQRGSQDRATAENCRRVGPIALRR
jgi:DNA-binding LytR/AlgR family response regulator